MDSRGNFAVFGGLVTAGLALILGSAVDLSMQYRARSALQAAADAAALAGARVLQKDASASPDAEVNRMARANLPADFGAIAAMTTVDPASRQITVRLASALRPNFLPIARINTLHVMAEATSSIEKGQHTDFYFLLDVSESMNIAASDADRDTLEYWTGEERNGEKCAFACHEGGTETMKSPYQVARDYGVRLRIDLVREASDTMIDKILAGNAEPGTLKTNRIATAGFSWDFEKGRDPSTDAADLKNSIRGFSVANQHTRFWSAFESFSTMLGAQGTGDSEDSPRKIAILVTDGVKDEGFGWWELGPLDTDLCNAIKAKDIELAVMEIKYIERPEEHFYNERVAWYYPNISRSLKSCASPGLYFLATDADQAANGLVELTEAVLAQRSHLVR